MSYKLFHQSKSISLTYGVSLIVENTALTMFAKQGFATESTSSKRPTTLQVQDRVRNLLNCYKHLSKQNKVQADLIWESIVPPFFVPVSKGGHLKVLQAAIIGEKNPGHLYTKIVNKLVS